MSVTTDHSELSSDLYERFLAYLNKNNIEVNADSNNRLRLHCSDVIYEEDRTFIIVGTTNTTDALNFNRYLHERVSWKQPGIFLACNGFYSNNKPLWRFSFAIHRDYIHDLPDEAISYLRQMMWYQGRA